MANITGAVEMLEKVASLPDIRIDQLVGMYEDGRACCVGAHLAYYLDIAEADERDYVHGSIAWAELLGGNLAHAIVLLREAGAVEKMQNPFGGAPWKISIAKVCHNLRAIETLPSLRERQFKHMHLDGLDLSDTDFRGSNFERSGLYDSTFSNCDLRRCNLKSVSALHTDFTHADLTNADMRGGSFNRAIFDHATMFDVRISTADFLDAEFDHTDMTRNVVKDGNFYNTDLSKVIWQEDLM